MQEINGVFTPTIAPAADTATADRAHGIIVGPVEIVERALGLLKRVAPCQAQVAYVNRGHEPSTLYYSGHTSPGNMPVAELGPFQVAGWESQIKSRIRVLGEPFFTGSLDNAVAFGYATDISMCSHSGYWLLVNMRVMPLYSGVVREWLERNQVSALNGYTILHYLSHP